MHRPIVCGQIGLGFHNLNSRQGSHFLLSENADMIPFRGVSRKGGKNGAWRVRVSGGWFLRPGATKRAVGRPCRVLCVSALMPWPSLPSVGRLPPASRPVAAERAAVLGLDDVQQPSAPAVPCFAPVAKEPQRRSRQPWQPRRLRLPPSPASASASGSVPGTSASTSPRPRVNGFSVFPCHEGDECLNSPIP